MTNTALLVGLLMINTIFLLREFVKSVIMSKRLKEAEDTLEIKILEVINLEQFMGKQIQELRAHNKQLKQQQKELTPVEE